MPLPTDYRDAATDLLSRLKESKRPLTEIAREAGVSYDPLWKWVNGRKKMYNLLDGERVYHFLTGQTFLK